MLALIPPSDIDKVWHLIKGSIERLVPSYILKDPNYTNNVLKMLLADDLKCWIFVKDEVVKGIVVTQVLTDPFLCQRNLLVYLMDTFTRTTRDDWSLSLQKLITFAKESGCTHIVAYTTNEGAKKIVEKFTRVEYFISLEV